MSQRSLWTQRSLAFLRQNWRPDDGHYAALRARLYARDYRDRLLVLTEIFPLGAAGVPLLLEACRDPHPGVRALALKCLSAFSDRADVAHFLETVRKWRGMRCGATLRVHQQAITGLALNPDGQIFASAAIGADAIVVGNLLDGKCWNAVRLSDDRLRGLVFTPDGSGLLGWSDRWVMLWDWRSGELVNSIEIRNIQQVIVVDHVVMIADGDGVIYEWNWKNNTLANQWNTSIEIISVIAVNSSRLRLAIATRDGKLQMWCLVTRKRLWMNCLDDRVEFLTLAFDPEAEVLWTGDRRSRLSSWDVDSGRLIDTWGNWDDRGIRQVVPVVGSPVVLHSCGMGVKIWHRQVGGLIHELVGHRGAVAAIGVTQDGKRVVTGGDDGMIKIWQWG